MKILVNPTEVNLIPNLDEINRSILEIKDNSGQQLGIILFEYTRENLILKMKYLGTWFTVEISKNVEVALEELLNEVELTSIQR